MTTEPSMTIKDIDALAQEIRRLDGSHSLGAGTMAELLAPFIANLIAGAASSPSSLDLPRDRDQLRADAGEDGWRLLPLDYLTHHGDWRRACVSAHEGALDEGDKSYWQKQIAVLDRIRSAIDQLEVDKQPEPDDPRIRLALD